MSKKASNPKPPEGAIKPPPPPAPPRKRLIGEISTCQTCGKPIEYLGAYWLHTMHQPRHIAVPKDKP